MADKRAFAQFDVGYLDNPKIMEVFDASAIAVCMHFASVLYCAQHLTDGVIALRAMQRKVGGTADDAQLLIDAGLWHLPGHDCPDCPQVDEGRAYVHNYLEHNRTSDGVKGRSEAAKIGANARWGKRRGSGKSNADRMQNASESQSESDANAMPREKEREREKEEAKASSPEIPRPDIDGIIQGFSELLKANDVKHKPGASWRTAARLLIDKDGYTPEQVMYVARFATQDEFWKSNILSVPKLREKFEALKIKAQAAHALKNPKPTGAQNRLQAGFDLLQQTRAEKAQRQQQFEIGQ